MNILQGKDIFKTFEGEVPVEVLRGVSLEIQAGESLAIVGKSGEGKSTLLHILGLLETPTSGSLTIEGEIPSPQKMPLLRNQKIGFIFQAYNLLEDMSVLDNVLLPQKIGRQKYLPQRGLDLLEEVGLLPKAKTMARLLSGGEKQRVAIARALCNDPPLIIADEPTGNLDRTHSMAIQDLLISSAKKRGKALILATHDEAFASLCDRFLSLKDGHLYTQAV